MPSYKLVYFNIRGRAETARMLFAQAGVEYEDCRITSEEFKTIKEDVTKCPLGQLPVLFVDDKPIPQSHAIERHLARTLGLYGKNEMEATRIDVACECVNDISTLAMKLFFEEDETKQAELTKSFVEKDSVTLLTALCQYLEENSNGKGFFVGDKMTLADITIFNLASLIFESMPALAGMYPLLRNFITRMNNELMIAAWIAKRPENPY